MSNTFHLSLDVPDLDRAIAFYEQLFGQAPAKRKPGYAKFELADPPVALALQQAGRPALSHLGIRVGGTEQVESCRHPTPPERARHPRRTGQLVLLRPPGQGLGGGPGR